MAPFDTTLNKNVQNTTIEKYGPLGINKHYKHYIVMRFQFLTNMFVGRLVGCVYTELGRLGLLFYWSRTPNKHNLNLGR